MTDGPPLDAEPSALADRLVAGARARPVRAGLGGAVLLGVLALWVGSLLAPDSLAATLFAILTAESTLASTLRRSVPIVFAALGGIFAEKTGVINIGLEGLLIVSAFGAAYGTYVTGSVWVGLALGVVTSTVLAAVFAVICIEFRADQIIAGLAIWLVALGLAPFGSQVVFGGPNSAGVETFDPVVVPVLSAVPWVGALFSASPPVYLMFVAVAASWYVLNRTTFGRWVEAAGENPKALDTAGVDVSRVRYVGVLLSGALSGIGGGALVYNVGQFTGNGPTMVNGRGFIAIVTYLFGNYNPVGAYLATTLFAGLNAVQNELKSAESVAIPDSLVQTLPFIAVIVVLALVGKTRLPAAAGDHYESGED